MRSIALFAFVGMVVGVSGNRILAAQAPAKVVPADGIASDRFGSSVATLGNMLVIGSPRTPFSPSPAPGAAYVIERVGQAWTQTGKLQPGTTGVEDLFGTCVTVSRNLLAVGAPSDSQHSPGAGAVYVFRRTATGWVQDAKLLPPNFSAFKFGSSVDLWDDTLIVGERNTSPSGLAYAFRRSNQGSWIHEATLTRR